MYRTVAQRMLDDGDPTHQKAIDATLEAERHANGAAKLLDDARLSKDSSAAVQCVEQAHRAARRAERAALLARGYLTRPGPLVGDVERPAAYVLVCEVRDLLGPDHPLGSRLKWLAEVIEARRADQPPTIVQ